MSAFVILAGGKGTRIGRVGETLHKALVPLGGKAVISHQLELAPHDARIIIVVKHRAEQIKTYMRLAHPRVNVTYVDQPDGIPGPGTALMAAREAIGDDDLIFTSCDTLWTRDDSMWDFKVSWAATAPIPAGTDPERWCRFLLDGDVITRVLDKEPGGRGVAYTGLACIIRADLHSFWVSLEDGSGGLVQNERQVSSGLAQLARRGWLMQRRIQWQDVGDEAAYRRAVANVSGYDWTKIGEATYVLPETGRVVKFFADPKVREERCNRAYMLKGAVPEMLDAQGEMMAYEFIDGVSLYDYVRLPAHIDQLLLWAHQRVWMPVAAYNAAGAADEFYRVKTNQRILKLQPELRRLAEDAVSRIDWGWLCSGVVPVTFHGDFNFGNLLFSPLHGFVGIDWRENFAGRMWGDRRYDVAKLIGGVHTHWDNARRGDFTPWHLGPMLHESIRQGVGVGKDTEVIGALCYINSAPLHAAPLDEILVQRGVAWLEEVLG